MPDTVTPAMLEAEIITARKDLNAALIGATPLPQLAMLRATFNVRNDEWNDKRRTVFSDYGGKRSSANESIRKWKDHAVKEAKLLVNWEGSSDEAKRRWLTRKAEYITFIDTIAKDFDSFHRQYVNLGGSAVPRFKANALTPRFVAMLRIEFPAWYERQLVTPKPLIVESAKLGIVRFFRQHREMTVLLMTIHSQERPAEPERSLAIDAVLMQLTLSPVLGLAAGLYIGWDSQKTLGYKNLSELERAILAMAALLSIAARLVKTDRAMYTPERLSQVYGGHVAIWAQAISYSALLTKERGSERLIEATYEQMTAGTMLSNQTRTDAKKALTTIVKSFADAGSAKVLPPVSLEPAIIVLWSDLQSDSRSAWLVSPDLILDGHAVRRVLLMGPNLERLQCQLLTELAESYLGSFLRSRPGIYTLDINVPDGRFLEFVPGHCVRAGDTDPKISNRQISDGVLGYWDDKTFVIAAVLEVKVPGSGMGSREFGFGKTAVGDLTRHEKAQLRAYSNREWVERKEVAERKGTPFTTRITDVDEEILKGETGSQVARDIERLDKLDRIRINGILAPFKLLQDPSKPTTKIFAIGTKGFNPARLEMEITSINKKRKTPFQFEPFALPVTASDVEFIAKRLYDHSYRMVYCPGTINDCGLGCKAPTGTVADFIAYIRKIHGLAVAYGGSKSPNQLVMEWLRHVDYNDTKWFTLIGGIDNDWIANVKSKSISLFGFVSDPRWPINIKVSHLGATMNAVYKEGTPARPDFNAGDVAGWGGDWMSFYAEWRNSGVSSGKAFCREQLAQPNDLTTFKLRDLVEDADGYNIAMALRRTPSRTIVDEFVDLFKPGGGYATRFSRFFKDRFGGTAADATASAKEMLLPSGSHPIIDFGQLYITLGTMPPSLLSSTALQDFCDGFGEVLEQYAAVG